MLEIALLNPRQMVRSKAQNHVHLAPVVEAHATAIFDCDDFSNQFVLPG